MSEKDFGEGLAERLIRGGVSPFIAKFEEDQKKRTDVKILEALEKRKNKRYTGFNDACRS